MTHAQIQAHKYIAAILITDITEERVRLGEILAPDWFMRAWLDGWRMLERVGEGSRR